MRGYSQTEGNVKTHAQLISQINSGRISHAHLFAGAPGSEKLLSAIELAKYINCQQKKDNKACGQCVSCLKYNNLTHPDLHLIFPVITHSKIKKPISDDFISLFREKYSKNPYLDLKIWLDSFSENNKSGKQGYIYKQESDILHKKLSLKNFEAEYKTIIIWLPETMQLATSNKLLKILEEPPNKTIFILVSDKPELLLPTITSRLQTTYFRSNTELEKKKILLEKFPDVEVAKIESVMKISNGSLGSSIDLIQKGMFEQEHLGCFVDWMRLCYSKNVAGLVRWSNETSKEGRLRQIEFLKYSLEMIRRSLFFNLKIPSVILSQKEKRFLTNFHKFINIKNVEDIVESMEFAIKNISRNANSKISLYQMSLEIMSQYQTNNNYVKK